MAPITFSRRLALDEDIRQDRKCVKIARVSGRKCSNATVADHLFELPFLKNEMRMEDTSSTSVLLCFYGSRLLSVFL
ncbi:hypothetical protein OUZ56_001829 [Daphnia magna]|uniref:Uncharacterized protein n=1 Tax=Daphnia magna TaxID=35525 RepID=A0ABR0A3U9_9CRUS|nr:hypothetical protein OUZ56_001829 [Daphnia magna]